MNPIPADARWAVAKQQEEALLDAHDDGRRIRRRLQHGARGADFQRNHVAGLKLDQDRLRGPQVAERGQLGHADAAG